MSTTRKTFTPWGEADHSTREIPGIIRHYTPSHGGLHCSPERQAVISMLFPQFRPWAKAPWYEEDCDWCIPVLAFWKEYRNADDSGRRILFAVRTVRHSTEYFGPNVVAYVNSDPGLLECVAIAESREPATA